VGLLNNDSIDKYDIIPVLSKPDGDAQNCAGAENHEAKPAG
jgi:hypothetical protein